MNSQEFYEELKETNKPIPVSGINPGIIDKLIREKLVKIVLHPSPFKKHKGSLIEHIEAA
ncbi:Uncharacterized protein dnl_63180 [Desulfonema limicola]|uniref:Uncharacterized protein n=1 Tax=Desulfonema limicola TaxID=45656 RepID=A0A975GJS0_9BACT|nr:hypothetical protein [Desulfonema limicola]QTA83894.1 Uncharacterized protein dnl_63180 [Desulfonema limicola]